MAVNGIPQSQIKSYEIWYDYNHGNKLGTSEEDYTTICNNYSNVLNNWKKYAEKAASDENEYRITDDKVNAAKESGEKEGKNTTKGLDDEADNGKSGAFTIMNWGGGICGAAAGVLLYIKKIAEKVGIVKNSGGGVLAAGVVAALGGLLLGSAISLKATNTNKEQAEACQRLNEDMPVQQAKLADAQEQMDEAKTNSEELAEDAEDNNEDAGDKIEGEKTEFDLSRIMFRALKTKAQNGTPLTQGEKSSLNDLKIKMEDTVTNIDNIQEETKEYNEDVVDEQTDLQSEFDSAATSMEEVTGFTEYAQSFDYDTYHNAGLVRDSVNIAGYTGAAGVIAAGIKVIATAGLNFFAHFLGGVAIAEGTTAGILFKGIANDQSNYREIAGAEIEARKTTEDLNEETHKVYEEDIEIASVATDMVKELTLPDPDDLEVPPEDGIPGDGVNPNNDPNKKKNGEE